MAHNNWLREWFDYHKNYYISKMMNEKDIDKFTEELWGFLRFATTSAYGRGRRVGQEYIISKYIKPEQHVQKQVEEVK